MSRGPDDFGVWHDDSGIGLAHRRLSILDLSLAGHQVILLQNGNYSAMAATIIQLLSDEGKVKKLGESGRVLVNLHFRLANTATLHASVFIEVLKSNYKA